MRVGLVHPAVHAHRCHFVQDSDSSCGNDAIILLK